MTKFTFKRHARERGLSAVGADAPSSDIKLRGVVVGLLKSPTRGRWGSAECPQWRVRLMVQRNPTPTEPCPWRWATLTRRFDTEEQGRAWLQSLDAEAFARANKIYFER